MDMKISAASIVIFILISLSFTNRCYGQLQVGSYHRTCPNVETIVFRVISQKFSQDPSIAPALIRMYFHDCFSNGCDASILLDGKNSEKTAVPNLSVRGYEVIDAIKTVVEKECRGIVSCADIIALATRDLVTLTSGGGRYEVPTGRFDGFVSLASTVNLPSPSMTISQSASAFASRGLNITDMVLLLGGHTIGVTHCPFVQDRLYNFQNTGRPDPTIDPKLLNELRFKCPQNPPANNIINLDQNISSSNVLDVSFYNQIILHRGILQIDQELAVDGMTKNTVVEIAGGNDFLAKFGAAMVKLGSFGVKTMLNGEIRRSCRSCKNKMLCMTE